MTRNSIEKNTALVKKIAGRLKFDYCGISEVTFLKEEEPRLIDWLKNKRHGEMDYMAGHFEKRLDPTRLVEGARSVISLVYNYYPGEALPVNENYQIARYAYGEDYHKVIRKKLYDFIRILREDIGEINGRAFVDSAPVMERQWAAKSGIGWIGKNTLLLNREMGSFFFLAELITDLELIYDSPVNDYCGTCTRCIDACPTDAIQPYQVDASKCISYLTIELKDHIPIPDQFKGKMNDWIFGCDICQEVCPWNRFSKPHHEPAFQPPEVLFHMRKRQWEEMTEDIFQNIFKKSPLKRAKFKGLKRNINFIRAPGNKSERS